MKRNEKKDEIAAVVLLGRLVHGLAGGGYPSPAFLLDFNPLQCGEPPPVKGYRP